MLLETEWSVFANKSSCKLVVPSYPGYAELDISDARIHAVKPIVFLATWNETRCYLAYRGDIL
ncbi:MAG: hypothetical protein QXO97_09295 [Candidatus Nezhaarchaeales archaeon]